MGHLKSKRSLCQAPRSPYHVLRRVTRVQVGSSGIGEPRCVRPPHPGDNGSKNQATQTRKTTTFIQEATPNATTLVANLAQTVQTFLPATPSRPCRTCNKGLFHWSWDCPETDKKHKTDLPVRQPATPVAAPPPERPTETAPKSWIKKPNKAPKKSLLFCFHNTVTPK